jgi:hypothetical protein
VARRSTASDVFINIPFDRRNEYLYLSLIAAIVGLGLAPRCVVEIRHDAARLKRIFDLIRSCKYSIHDLSAVRLSRGPFRVPRFNMPFELGLAAAVSLSTNGRQKFRVMDAVPHRVTQSLSDLGGYDAFVHRRTAAGVFEAVADMFAFAEESTGQRRVGFQDHLSWRGRASPGTRRCRCIPTGCFRPTRHRSTRTCIQFRRQIRTLSALQPSED